MNKKVRETVIEYSNANIIMPPETIEGLADLLAEELDVKDYFKNLVFNNPKYNSTSYSFIDRTINLDFNCKDNNFKLDSAFRYNTLYLFVLLHELNHAAQLKFLNENTYESLNDPIDKYRYLLTKDFFRIMFLASGSGANQVVPSSNDIEFVKQFLENTDYFMSTLYYWYKKIYHDYFYCEREADIEANKYVLQVLRNSKQEELKNYYKNKLVYSLIYNYSTTFHKEIISTPISRYLGAYGYEELKDKIDILKNDIIEKYPDLSLESKMKYGLDITYDEYKKEKRKIKKLK